MKGITLIALVITIIILLILAGISISMLTGNNGILNKAITSKEEQIKAEMKEQLILAIQDLQVEKRGNATLDDITQDWINKNLEEYDGIIIESVEGIKIKMKKSGVTQRFIIDLKLNVTHVDYDGSIEFVYKEKERNGNKVKISIYIQDEKNGINKIEFPNLEPFIGNGTKEEILLDYEIELGKEYKIIITSENGEKIEEILLIKKVVDLIEIIEANDVYVCDEYLINNNTLIQEKLFNGNIDERRTMERCFIILYTW